MFFSFKGFLSRFLLGVVVRFLCRVFQRFSCGFCEVGLLGFGWSLRRDPKLSAADWRLLGRFFSLLLQRSVVVVVFFF